MAKASSTFRDLHLAPWLVQTCSAVRITIPTPVQQACIPVILAGKDVVASAATGTGKTAAFALPILHQLAHDPYGVFALVLTPTRELAFQIADQFQLFGKPVNLRVATVVGGVDEMKQKQELARRPHVVVATPGRLAAILDDQTDARVFHRLRFLALDEADRLLEPSFTSDLSSILAALPQKRQTLLFSATMAGAEALSSIVPDDAVKWSAAPDFQPVQRLVQEYVFMPARVRDCYLVHLLDQPIAEQSVVVFCTRCQDASILTEMLRQLEFKVVPLHSMLSQRQRLASVNLFKTGQARILIATDVASRGLDIPTVELVINYQLPANPTDYIHRVGRTARAGRGGLAVSLITQFDVALVHRVEDRLGKKLELRELDEDEVLKRLHAVSTARRIAALDIEERAMRTGTPADRRRGGSKRKAADTEAEKQGKRKKGKANGNPAK